MNKFAQMIKMVFGTMNYPMIAEPIMNEIKASELAYVLDVLGILHIFPYTREYLNPLRDFDSYDLIRESAPKETHTTLMIGPNLDMLVRRITHPKIYWATIERKHVNNYMRKFASEVKVWIVCISRDMNSSVESLRIATRPTINITPMLMQGSRVVFENNLMIQPEIVYAQTNMRNKGIVRADGCTEINDSRYATRCVIANTKSFAFNSRFDSMNMTSDFIAMGDTMVGVPWSKKLFTTERKNDFEFVYINPFVEPHRVHRPKREVSSKHYIAAWYETNVPKDMIRFAYVPSTRVSINPDFPDAVNANPQIFFDVPKSSS